MDLVLDFPAELCMGKWKCEALGENIMVTKAKIDQYNIISFDIFNTILFREYSEPEQLFTAFGEYIKGKGQLKVCLTGGEFAKVREAAENEARKAVRKKGGIETITQIYQHFPAFLKVQPDVLADLELEFEKQHAYLNLEMIELLEYCKQCGKKIYLISDMYFSGEQIKDLLESIGFDWSLVDGLYVSADCQVDKITGKLFKYVKDVLGLDSNEWIHVGDDLTADVYGAKKQNIASYHYDIDTWCNETLIHENIFGGIYIDKYRRLRGLHGIDTDSTDEMEQAYKIGWTVFGPVLTCFSEWIIDIAKKNDIYQIYPLMREGVLITKLLNVSLREKGITDIVVKPLYISRRVTMFAQYEELNDACFDMLMEQEQTTIKDLFDLLGLQKEVMKFKDYLMVMLNDIDLPAYKQNGISLRNQLKACLFCQENKQIIDKLIKEQIALLYDYLHQEIDLSKNYITCDVGYRGRIQTSMHAILTKNGHDGCGIHTLLFGVNDAIKNYMQGVDIRGCLGNFGSNQKILDQLISYYYLLENVFMDETGSTKAYYLEQSTVKPMLSERKLVNGEIEIVQAIQKGVLAYYRLYLKYVSNHSLLAVDLEDVCERYEYSKILYRLFHMPDMIEAQTFLKLSYEMNVGSTYHNVIHYDEYAEIIKEMGIEKFLNYNFRNKQVWREGLVKLYVPDYQLTRVIDTLDLPYKYFADMFKLCMLLRKDGHEEIMVYGAGVVGHTLYQAAKYFGIRIKCFIDRNDALWGLMIGDGVITGLDDSDILLNECPIVVASYAYLDEIEAGIQEKNFRQEIYSVKQIQ